MAGWVAGVLVPSLQQGFPLTQTRKRDDLPRCAGAVVRDAAGRVLLVRRANEPSRGLWSIPGGRVEPGESTRECARREVREETGLDVEVGDLLLTTVIGPYLVDDYVATVVGGTLLAADDALEAAWFEVADVRGLDLSPALREALEALGL